MLSASGSISMSHAIAYYGSDEYFTREGKETNFWYGKLRTYYELPVKIVTSDFNNVVNENEITRKLRFRFAIPEILVRGFADEDFKRLIIQIAHESINKSLNFAFLKYKKYGLSFPKNDLIKREKVKNRFVFYVLSNQRYKGRCGFFQKVINDDSILRIYNQNFQRLCKENSIDIDPKIFDVANGTIKEQTGRVATDITFSLPKSISIAMFINNKKYHDSFLDLHHTAVKKTLDFIENNYLDHKIDGRLVQTNRGLLSAVCDHFSSRELDPQVHSHAMIFHNLIANSGRKTRLENHHLLKNIKHCGLIYRTEMLKLLEENNIRFKITDKQNVFFELEGFKKEWLDNFSKRTLDIEKNLKESGIKISNSILRKQFSLNTRKPKRNVSIDVLINEWNKHFQELGINDFKVERFIKNKEDSISTENSQIDVDSYLKTIMTDLTESQMAFTKEEFFYEAAKNSHEKIITIDEVFDFIAKEVKRGQLLCGIIGDEHYYYTRESKLLEESIYKDLIAGIGVYPGIPRKAIEGMLEKSYKRLGFSLSEDQNNALLYMANENQFNVIQGSAGAGKSTILKEMKYEFESAGWDVKGICFSGIGAQNIYEKSEIVSNTIHSFLNNLEKEAGNYMKLNDLKHKNEWNLKGLKKSSMPQLWVIDEASMISNKLMAKVIEAAKLRHAKICLIGDFKQLPSIGPGAVFSKIVQNKILPYADLKRHIRQKESPDNIKKAVTFCEKSFLKSMDNPIFGDLDSVKESVKSIKNNIQFIEDNIVRLNTIANDFCSLKPAIRNNSIVITSQNLDRITLNDSIRELLKAKNELRKGKVFELLDRNDRPNSLELSVGEKIIFLANSKIYNKDVRNGTVGIIKKIKGNKTKIATKIGVVNCDLESYKYIDYAYAVTIHKSQSQTIPENVYLNLNKYQKKSNNLNSFYVSLTRGKKNICIYTNGSLDEVSKLVYHKQFKPSVLDITKESPTFFEDEFDRFLRDSNDQDRDRDVV